MLFKSIPITIKIIQKCTEWIKNSNTFIVSFPDGVEGVNGVKRLSVYRVK